MLKLNSIGKTLLGFCAVGLTFVSLSASAQIIKSGSLNYLVSANGYKDIILGQDASRLTNEAGYMDNDSRPDADSCYTYALKSDNLLSIDSNLKLDMVGVRTYKNKVVNIYLFFAETDAYKVLSNFLQQYGQFTDKPVKNADVYNWNTPTVTLSLSYNADIDKGVAIFTFKPLQGNISVTNKQKLATVNLQASNRNQ